jgi:hypothetical protein
MLHDVGRNIELAKTTEYFRMGRSLSTPTGIQIARSGAGIINA